MKYQILKEGLTFNGKVHFKGDVVEVLPPSLLAMSQEDQVKRFGEVCYIEVKDVPVVEPEKEQPSEQENKVPESGSIPSTTTEIDEEGKKPKSKSKSQTIPTDEEETGEVVRKSKKKKKTR